MLATILRTRVRDIRPIAEIDFQCVPQWPAGTGMVPICRTSPKNPAPWSRIPWYDPTGRHSRVCHPIPGLRACRLAWLQECRS